MSGKVQRANAYALLDQLLAAGAFLSWDDADDDQRAFTVVLNDGFDTKHTWQWSEILVFKTGFNLGVRCQDPLAATRSPYAPDGAPF